MSGGAAEEIPQLAIRRVTAGPCVHEIRFTERGALNAEQVGMAVTSAVMAAKRAGIENQCVGFLVPAAAHGYETAQGKHSEPGRLRRCFVQSFKNAE